MHVALTAILLACARVPTVEVRAPVDALRRRHQVDASRCDPLLLMCEWDACLTASHRKSALRRGTAAV